MRALSLWQPWASAIFVRDHEGVQVKPDETRHWSTHIRGFVLIHAAKTKKGRQDIPDTLVHSFGLSWTGMPFGALLGMARIVACERTERMRGTRQPWQLQWGNYEPHRYCFLLEDPVLFSRPIPFKGAQGFFNVPDDVLSGAFS